MSAINAAITCVGGYVPDYVMTNKELEKIVDTTDEWITTRTGIKERRILKGEGKGTSVIGTKCVKGLLKKTNTNPKDIDLLICATVTPDMFFPSTANIISNNVGIKNAYSFDMSAACSGFLYSLVTGSQFIESGTHKKVVVVGADKMSSIVDFEDRNNCVLFGDGGGAVLLEPSLDENGIIDHILKSDGSGGSYLCIKGGGSKYPASLETINNKDHFIYQEGKRVFKFAVTNMANVSEEIMLKNNLKSNDISYLVPHQANKRIIDATAKKMNLDSNQIMVNIDKYANTTAASIPLALCDAYEQNKLDIDDNIILTSFGAGFTWGSCLIKWGI